MMPVVSFWIALLSIVLINEPATQPADRPVPSPSDALNSFILPDGYEINCFASEEMFPELANPIAMTFDASGRLWVAVSPTYPHLIPGDAPDDKLLVLEDTDGDGVADRSTVFADGLYIPTGFVLTGDGAYVVSQPNLLHVRDIDGDLVADERTIVLHGFGSEDSHHSMSALTWGPDGAIYLNEGTFHHTQIETPWGPRRVQHGGVIRYKPDMEQVDIVVSFPFANPWGHAIDRWGQSVISDASNGYNYKMTHLMGAHTYPDDIKGQGPYRNIRSFTPGGRRPSAGSEFIRSAHLPEEVQGRFVTSQCIGYHGLRWYDLEENGSGWITEAEEMELLQSTDTSFRPVSMEIGPDGAFYVLDWANPIVGHMQFNVRDPRRDHDHGRVWRITYPSRPLSKPPFIADAPVNQLLECLKAYENRTRSLARRALQEGDPKLVLPALAQWLEGLDEDDPEYEHHLVEALWIHQGLNHVDESLLERVLSSENPNARMAGMRALRWWLNDIDDPWPHLERGVLDPHQGMRLETVVALGHLPDIRSAELVGLATSQPMDADFETAFNRTLTALRPWGTPMGEGTIAWQLKQMPDSDLLELEMDHFVARERMRRIGLPETEREAAIRWQAEQASRTRIEQLLNVASDLDPDEDALNDVIRMIMASSPEAISSERDRLLEMAVTPELDSSLRQAAWACLAMDDLDFIDTWRIAEQSRDPRRSCSELLGSISLLQGRDELNPVVEKAWHTARLQLPLESHSIEEVQGRHVRISLPNSGTITLAEVEVISDGLNIAIDKPCRQSSTVWGGDASLAVDGDANGIFSAGTSTHTREGGESPFWEVDLEGMHPIDGIRVSGRSERPFDQRLDGYRIEILDDDREIVYAQDDLPAPQFTSQIEIGRSWDPVLVESALNAMCGISSRSKDSMEIMRGCVDSSNDPLLRLLAVEAMQSIDSEYWTEDDDRWRIREIELETIPDRMIYDKKKIQVSAGEPVRLRLANKDSMPHNLLICRPGSMRRVGIAADNMGTGPDAVKLNYVPDMKEILHVMAMVEPGEVDELLFMAPERPGRYPYVCTFPGHWPMMNGVMTVRKRK
ncbi:MAG: hypothetical protein CMJ40_08075 [Phycisphaerae bacterium]|nr:hypothetical protein [Phycisphaerae bacterium]